MLRVGSVKKALLIKEKSSEYEQINKLFDIIDKENLVNFINSANIIYENKDDIYNILDYINILLDIKIRSNSNNSFKFANCIFTVEEVKKRFIKKTGIHENVYVQINPIPSKEIIEPRESDSSAFL